MALLEIIIGLVFILAFLSLVCSALQEFIANFTARRAKTLQAALATLLHSDADGGNTRDAVLNHPIIRALCRQGDAKNNPPSYIPASVFAEALIDHVARRVAQTGNLVQDFKAGLATLPLQGGNSALARALTVITADVQTDLSHLKARIETHYDTTMERVSGWYKRHVMASLAGLAILVAGATNADLFSIGNRLARDSTLRSSIVAVASRVSETPAPANDSASTTTEAEKLGFVIDQTKDLELPLGWSSQKLPTDAWSWIKKICGILVTATMLTLGAPFWFDRLKDFLNLRASGLVPKPSS